MSQHRTVAVVGASQNRSKFGNKSLRAHRRAGWRVFPVNPKGGTMEGLDVYQSLKDIPVSLERISVYLSPEMLIDLLPAIADVGCDELWLNPGSYDDSVLCKARELGLTTVTSCSIVDVGYSPSDFPD